MAITELATIGGIIFGSSGLTGLITWIIRRGDRKTDVLRDMLVHILKLQSLNCEAVGVSLVCVKEGHCNGEVDSMLARLNAAKLERSDYLADISVGRW